MSVKDGISSLVGSKITAVVVAANPTNPRQQVFLVLDGRWYYEFYGSEIHSGSSVREADAQRTIEYARKAGGTIATYEVEG